MVSHPDIKGTDILSPAAFGEVAIVNVFGFTLILLGIEMMQSGHPINVVADVLTHDNLLANGFPAHQAQSPVWLGVLQRAGNDPIG